MSCSYFPTVHTDADIVVGNAAAFEFSVSSVCVCVCVCVCVF